MRPQVGASKAGRAGDKTATFGQRRSAGGPSLKSTGREFVGRTSDGGIEMSWTPSSSSSKKYAEEDARAEQLATTGKKKGKEKTNERKKGVESFGAGMEKGGEEAKGALSESDRKGRTERRRGIRSGSKNAIFGRS